MEFKLKVRYIGVIIAMFFILILIDWYKDMDYLEIEENTDSTRIGHKELLQLNQSYTNIDFKKQYVWESTERVKITKGDIPFTWNKEVIYKSEQKLVPNKY